MKKINFIFFDAAGQSLFFAIYKTQLNILTNCGIRASYVCCAIVISIPVFQICKYNLYKL